MPWDFPGGPVVKTVLPLKRVKVRSLVEELRSHRPLGVAKKKKSCWASRSHPIWLHFLDESLKGELQVASSFLEGVTRGRATRGQHMAPSLTFGWT